MAIGKKTGGGKRGGALPKAQIEVIANAYNKAVEDLPAGSTIGLGKLNLPPGIRVTVAKGALKQPKEGKSAGEISAAKEKSRKWAPSAKQSGDRNIKKVKKLLAKNNATSVNSLRLVAARIGASKSTARRIIRDHLRMRLLKHVKTTVSTVAKKKKRAKKGRGHSGCECGRRGNEPNFLVGRNLGRPGPMCPI